MDQLAVAMSTLEAKFKKMMSRFVERLPDLKSDNLPTSSDMP